MANKEPAKCTVEELQTIITEPSDGFWMMPSRAMDEVFPGLYVGDESSATNLQMLSKLNFTHVLNTAKGKDRFHVNTNLEMYKKVHIEFLGIEATDESHFKLHQFFDKTSNFIHQALQSQGKILVHCREGHSRSATIATAYLMMKCHMTAQDALRLVREKREVGPNDGFLQQLSDLNEKLRKQGHFTSVDTT